jgi:hypothetical protein
MRLMSFFLTQDQFRAKTKFETRRLGWKFARVGQKVGAVVKSMGRKRGEPLVHLGMIELLEVAREPLNAITQRGCDLEGFPHLTPAKFVAMFCKHMRCLPTREVTRIRFAYHVGAGIHPITCAATGASGLQVPPAGAPGHPWASRGAKARPRARGGV